MIILFKICIVVPGSFFVKYTLNEHDLYVSFERRRCGMDFADLHKCIYFIFCFHRIFHNKTF